MAPVQLKFVVSFSSQDERHPVQNLISGDGFKRWLSAPGLKTGHIEAVFQLERPCVITHIDVGSVWCANMAVEVGCSSWPQSQPYRTLVATANLITPMDCRNGNAVVKTRMFNASDFMQDVSILEWDRLRVRCRQPFRKDVQFGLSFIRIKGNFADQENNYNAMQSPHRNKIKHPTVPGPSPKSVKPDDAVDRTPTRTRDKKNVSDESTSTPRARTVELQDRLLKIAGTAENGTPSKEALSRTAKLLLASANQSPSYSRTVPKQTNHRSALLSNSVHTRTAPPFEVEAKRFLACLQLNKDDLSTVTIADLRHRLEKRKRRKLTKEEKKKFMQLTEDFLRAQFEEDLMEPTQKEADVVESFPQDMSFDLCMEDSEDATEMSFLGNSDLGNSIGLHEEFENCMDENSHFYSETSIDGIESLENSQNIEKNRESGVLCDNKKVPDSSLNQSARVELFSTVTPKGLFKPGRSFLSSSKPNGSESPLITNSLSPGFDLRQTDAELPDLSVISNKTSENGDLKSRTLSSEPDCLKSTTFLTTPKINKPSPSRKRPAAPHVDRLVKRVATTPGAKEKAAKPSPKSGTNRGKKEKAPSSRRKLQTGETTQRENQPHSNLVSILCTDCQKMVPEANYLIHQVRCKYITPPKTDAIHSAGNSTQAPQNKGREYTPTAITVTNVDLTNQSRREEEQSVMVECPICNYFFSSERINTHANVCAEATLIL